MGIVTKSKAIAVNDTSLKEEFRVEGLVDDGVRWFGEEVGKEDWL